MVDGIGSKRHPVPWPLQKSSCACLQGEEVKKYSDAVAVPGLLRLVKLELGISPAATSLRQAIQVCTALRCSVLRCAMLCYAVLCCAALCYAVLCLPNIEGIPACTAQEGSRL